MIVGTVKWFESKKGFGFILSPEGKDVFVHFSTIEGDGFRSLKDGEQVEYEQLEGEKGLLAKGVKRVAASAKVRSSRPELTGPGSIADLSPIRARNAVILRRYSSGSIAMQST